MALLTRAVWWVVPAFLVGAAVYQLALVIRGETDHRTLAFIAVLAMLVGAALALLTIRLEAPRLALALLAPAAAAFAVARFYTYDPYFSPTLRRYSDDGAMPPAWLLLLAAASIVVGVLSWRTPRVGAAATAATLVLLAGTTALMSSH
jgi:uncharacterized membrane protein YbaN (DUF454 family)